MLINLKSLCLGCKLYVCSFYSNADRLCLSYDSEKKMFKFDLMFVIIIKGIKIKNTVLIRENEDTKRVI